VKVRKARSKKSTTKSTKVRKQVRIKKSNEEDWPTNGSVGKSIILDQRPDLKKIAGPVGKLVRQKGGSAAVVSSPVLIPLNGTLVSCKYLALRYSVRKGNRIIGTVSLKSPESPRLVWRDQESFGFFEVRDDKV
jgi:hypothetical protein